MKQLPAVFLAPDRMNQDVGVHQIVRHLIRVLLLFESTFRFGSEPAYPGVRTLCKFRMIVVFPNRIGSREDLQQPTSFQFASRKVGQECTSLAGTHGAIDFVYEVRR